MKFAPMSEKEARDASAPAPLPNGDYDFEVISAVEKNSKSSGMGMFELELKVYKPDGGFRTIRDYVMTEGKAAWRLRQCCEGLGLVSQYEQGDLTQADFQGASGRCALITQEDPTGQYSPQNRVKTYIKAQSSARPAQRSQPQHAMATAGSADDLDDEIPF